MKSAFYGAFGAAEDLGRLVVAEGLEAAGKAYEAARAKNYGVAIEQAKKAARGAFEQQFAEAIRQADEAFSRKCGERGYLGMLAARLKLDEKLVEHLHATVEGVTEPVPVKA